VKIVVCLNARRGAHEKAGALGADDAHALALALALGEGHTITALLPGVAADEAPLRRALAAGATKAVRVVGEDFGSADFHTLGQALAAAIKRLGADLVLAPARSDDDGLDAVPASVARHLGALHVAWIEELSAVEGGGTVELTVRGGGRVRRLRVPLPAVLSVIANAATTATLPESGDASAAIEVISLVDPEATVVRRRTELLGQPELPARATEEVPSPAALVEALLRA
jgi:electron transfer flavoprotein alpha/beta subunit